MLAGMSYRLESRRLYIADLARRQHAMEQGQVAMQPLAYRVLSRRLQLALAGLSERDQLSGFALLPPHLLPLVVETLEARHFEDHGMLVGAGAAECRAAADALLGRMKNGRRRRGRAQ
jgi:hypothetical protein